MTQLISDRPQGASIRLPYPPVLLAHLLGLYLSVVFVFYVVAPTIDQQTLVLDSRFLFDSIAYLKHSHGISLRAILSVHLDYSGGGLFPSLGLTNSLVLLQGRVALALFPGAPHLAILGINYVLFVLAIRNVRKLAVILGLAWTQRVQLLIVLNPFIWMNLVTLTKEAWGISSSPRSRLPQCSESCSLVLLGAVSMLVRESYVFIALGMYLAVVLPGRRALWLPVVVSIVAGVAPFLGHGNLVPFADSKSAALQQRSADVMQAMAHLQGYPFGHLLAAPVVLLINIASPALNQSYYRLSVGNLYNVADTVSSLLFIGLIIVGLRRLRRAGTGRGLWAGDVMMRLLVAFAALITLYPISQHRYLLPAYPLLVLWALAKPHSDSEPHRPGTQRMPVTVGARNAPW